MIKAVVIDEDAANRLSLAGLPDDWVGHFTVPDGIVGLDTFSHDELLYFVGARAGADSKLLVIKGNGISFFSELPERARTECFARILRAGLSQFQRGVKLPSDWKLFRTESLLSFQTNRWSSGLRTRVYVDVSPENTEHVYAFAIVQSESAPLNRAEYDEALFEHAVLRYPDVIFERDNRLLGDQSDNQVSFSLTHNFQDSDIAQGIRYSIWRDSKLTFDQRRFFLAPFNGPLRVRGAAGTGKTLVLVMRFLKEIYQRIEGPLQTRAAFIAHGQETADQIRTYLMLIDERQLLTDPPPNVEMQVTTLHAVANEFINIDTEGVQPISLDGTEGRTFQFELIDSTLKNYREQLLLGESRAGISPHFLAGLGGQDQNAQVALCCDLIDEFANVLEAFGTRDVDEIADRYLRSQASPRGLGQSADDRQVVLQLYRSFRDDLKSLGVVSLDQFISDFHNYLNSFRWQAVRERKGFDFIFVDELHLFNRLERPVFGYLLRTPRPARVAVAYDPRQSPRSSFLPEIRSARDNVWTESKLDFGAQQFDLSVVFRYTPQIADFLRNLNHHFPAFDLGEDWSLPDFNSQGPDGPKPRAYLYPSSQEIAKSAAERARRIARLAKRGERVAVLCLDPERFRVYRSAGVFQADVVCVSGRDEIGAIQKFARRVVLSVPEYVAGLQFSTVLLLDVNASLVGRLGGGLNGIQRFISAVYLGASRAKTQLELFSDDSEGGFAQPIRDAIRDNVIDIINE